MSCCGKSRIQFTGTPRVSIQQAGSVLFEYTGRTRLIVIGPVTRARYDFVGYGARLQVDRRDSNSIAAVPALRRV
jgi:hypothetical protein